MHESGSLTIRRALFFDGVYWGIVGVLLALATSWLAGELPVPGRWSIAGAGIVAVVWGGALVAASRYAPTRNVLGLVAVVNVATVVAILAWLLLDGDEMTGFGLAVVGVICVPVVRFAVYQSMLLRQ